MMDAGRRKAMGQAGLAHVREHLNYVQLARRYLDVLLVQAPT